jgi:broad specificity phosphatase PhoE
LREPLFDDETDASGFNAGKEAGQGDVMARGLLYGNNVVNLIGRLHGVDRTVLIVRHSERPSFDNLPIGAWDSVGLTERGIEAARDLGRALAQEEGIHTFGAYGWGLKRCIDTADAVAAGAKESGCRISGQGTLAFTSPIADRRKYDVALGSGHWEEFVDDWLRGRAQDGALVPADRFATGFLRELFDRQLPESEGVSLIVTHDLQIYPLVGFLLGIPIRKLDFLNGLIIKTDPRHVRVGFDGTVRSLNRSELFS